MNIEKIKLICQEWIDAGIGDECFWEYWDKCPTEETLSPEQLLEVLNEVIHE